MWPRIDGVRLIIDQEWVAMEAIEEHWIYKKRLRSKFRKNELKICFIVAAIWFIFQNHLPTYSWLSMVLPVVLGEFAYRGLSLERKWDDAFFEKLDMSALVEDDSIRELKKIHAILQAKLNNAEKIEIMTRGQDEKGPTWGKEDNNLDQEMERRDAVLEGEKYHGMEDDLTQPEQLVKEADDVYAEMAQKRWEQAEMADEDLIEHGVKRLGDLLTTEYFDKNAEEGVFQKIAKPENDSENDMLDGGG